MESVDCAASYVFRYSHPLSSGPSENGSICSIPIEKTGSVGRQRRQRWIPNRVYRSQMHFVVARECRTNDLTGEVARVAEISFEWWNF